jgi:predicted dehydrogenase
MKTYRLGIVGLGRMGSTIDAEVEDYPAITLPYSIAAAARAIPRLELVAGCDIVAEKNRAFRDKWGVVNTHTDYEKMLASEKLDMVAICTPGPLHARMTLAAAQAGVAMIYCEKAMACSMKEADEVKKALESRHTVFNTGVLRRFDPRYHQARELIQKGRIGTPRAAVHYASASLLHGHIHSVDTILFLLGDKRVKSVWGELRPRDIVLKDKRLDKDPLAVYQLEVEGGVEATTVPAGNWDFEVIGDEGVLRSTNNNIEWSLRTRRPLGKKFHTFQPVEYPRVAPRSATVNCLQDLVNSYEKHRPSLGNVATAHHATEVCLTVAESHLLGGRRVSLPMTNRDLYVYHF